MATINVICTPLIGPGISTGPFPYISHPLGGRILSFIEVSSIDIISYASGNNYIVFAIFQLKASLYKSEFFENFFGF